MRGSVLRNSLGVISLVCMLVIALAVTGENTYAAGPNVTTHSKQEIANYIKNNNIDLNEAVSFSTMPVKNNQQGQLTTASENSALRTLNAVRYIAGLNEVSLDATYGQKAQAGAFVNWCIGQLTHYPANTSSKPDGMSDSVWNDGISGAGNSNIAYGRDNLNITIVNGWMADTSSVSNLESVGHRMWCLNPAMGKTGFGATTGSSYADKYYAMWSSDGSASGSQTNVIWPAQKMPVEFFGSNYPWSLATGNTTITSGNNVNVTLTRRSSSPSGAGTWTFSGLTTYNPSTNPINSYFVFQKNSPRYMGQPGAYIVFRPDGISKYKPGDIFDVTITGLGSETISYTVEFFSGYPVESIAFEESEYRLEYNTLTKKPTVQPAGASGYEVSYNSSNTSVATVNENGTVTRVAPGTTTITATVDGRFTSDGDPRTASYILKVPKSINSASITRTIGKSPEYTGSISEPEFIVKDGDKVLVKNVDYETFYPYGEPIEPGTYYPFFRGIGDYCERTTSASGFTLNKKTITSEMITLTPSTFTYNGSVQKPTVTVKHGDRTLTEGTDYTVNIPDSIEQGTYTVKVSAASSSAHYRSSATAGYEISRTIKPITSEMISVASPQTYTGDEIRPQVTVRDGSTTLENNNDYTLEYFNNTDAGTARVRVTGKGNYGSMAEKTFTIAPRPLASDMITLSPESFPYNGSTQKPGVTVKYNGKTLNSGTDYTVNNPGVKDRGTYTVTVTAVAGSNFSGFATKTFTIGKASLNGAVVSAAQSSYVYDGSEKKPAVTVKVGGVTLAASDYIVSYDNNVNAGTAIIRVTAADSGNYSGSAQGTFTISKQSISDDTKITIGSIAALTYNGQQHKPEPTVKHGSKPLSKGSDYEFSYGENKNSGNGTITITGKGNYSEARTATFVINAKAINDSSVRVDPIADQNLIASKTEYTPAVTVRDGGKILVKDTDYSVTYSDNTGAGTAEVTITGKGNYTASRKANFNIVIPADPEKAEAKNALDEKVTEMKLVETGEYSPEDRAALENAITAAETLLAKPYEDVTKDEYQSALQAMIDAKNTADVNLEERKRQEQQQNQPQPQPQPTVGPSVAPDRLGPDTPDYLKPDAAAVEQTIMNQRGDGEPKGSTYSLIQLKSSKQAAKSTTLKWKRVSGATTYVVYGNKCGKANRFQKLAVTGATSFKHTGLKKGTYYKYVVVAVKGDRATAISKVVHVATAGNKKAANPKSVTATVLKKSKATVKRGKTVKIKAKQNGKNIRKHRTLRYESANPAVATVSSKGTVRGVKAGKTKIYVYAQNGVAKAVTITVK